jgi:hypothetical protein
VVKAAFCTSFDIHLLPHTVYCWHFSKIFPLYVIMLYRKIYSIAAISSLILSIGVRVLKAKKHDSAPGGIDSTIGN